MRPLQIFRKNKVENYNQAKNNYSRELEEQRHNSENYIWAMEYLDRQGVPRGDAKGEYTIIHRFNLLEQKHKFNN